MVDDGTIGKSERKRRRRHVEIEEARKGRRSKENGVNIIHFCRIESKLFAPVHNPVCNHPRKRRTHHSFETSARARAFKVEHVCVCTTWIRLHEWSCEVSACRYQIISIPFAVGIARQLFHVDMENDAFGKSFWHSTTTKRRETHPADVIANMFFLRLQFLFSLALADRWREVDVKHNPFAEHIAASPDFRAKTH